MIDSWIMPGLSIQEIVDQKHNSSDVSILLDSEIIPRSSWSFLHPLPGTVIQIIGIPKGGGGEQGKSPIRILLTIAVMAAAAWVGGSGWALATLFGGSKVVAGLAGMAVAYLGMMAVNAIAPPPKPLDESSEVGTSASLTGMRNTFNPYGPVPKILGTHRVYPQYAARPYTEIIGDDQYLRLLFVVGYGPLNMSNYRIGETDINDFDGVEIDIMHGISGEAEQTLYTQTVEENQLSILLEQSGNWYLQTTEPDIDEISIDVTYPAGLYTLNSEGRRVSRKVELEIQYSIKDANNWTIGAAYGLVNAQETSAMTSQSGTGFTAFTVYRVVINNSSGVISLLGPSISTWTADPSGYGLQHNPPSPPPVPDWASPIARIDIPGNTTQITNSMITDERTTSAPDRQNANDFLPSQDSPLSMSIDVASGYLRLQFITEEARPELIRRTKRFRVANNQYDVRIKRLTADGGDDDVDEVYWTALRSITHEHPIQLDEDLAIIALRIKASDQLNGVVDTFNLIASGVIPDWNGSSWVDGVTSNPASLYREVLQCNANKQALADSRLNLDAIQDWHEDNQGGEKDINNGGTAVDKGSGKVGIPVNAHSFVDNQVIAILGTDNYDGAYEVDDTSSTNEIVIVATYSAETFSSSDKIYGQGFEFNLPVDFQMSIEDLLIAIASAGRARPDYLDGLHTIVQDKPQTIPAQHISPRNSWNFSGQKLFYQMPHAFRVKFKNQEKDYREDEIIVYDDGYNAGNATRFEMLDLPGITTRHLAWKHARFHIAVARLRPETYNVYMDAENLTCTPGDLIQVAHDVTMWGLGYGRVVSWTLDGGDATHVTLDDIMPMEVDNSYSIRFRDEDGSTSIHPVVLDVGEQTTLEFVTPISSANVPVVGSLALFGETSSESIRGIVQSIEPGNDLSALIVFVDEAPDIHISDTGDIPAFDSQITQPFDVLTSIGAPVIDAIRSDEGVMVKDPGGAIIPRIAVSFTYESGKLFDQIETMQVVYRNSVNVAHSKSQLFANFQTEVFLDEDIIEGDTYYISARYKIFDGRWGPFSTYEEETVVGRSTAPATPTSISATAGIDLIRLDWTTPPVIDFDHVRIWKAEEDVFPGSDPDWTVESAAGYAKSMVDEDVTYETTYYYFLKSADSSGNLSTVSASVNASPNKAGTGDISSVGGWVAQTTTLYKLASGQPDNSPVDGVVLDSGNIVVEIYEDAAKRIRMGKLADGVFGFQGLDGSGENVLFEISDAGALIAGWTINQNTLANSTNIILDAANKAISINDAVFENEGIQFQYNAGNPQVYIGDGSNSYMKYTTAGGLEIAGTLTVSSFVNLPSDENLVAYYSFDDRTGSIAIDNSGNGNDGSLVSSPVWGEGVSGGGLHFSRSRNDSVNLGTSDDLRLSGSRTYTAWINMNLDSWPGGTTYHILNNESYQNYGFVWRIDGTSGRQAFRTSQVGAATGLTANLSIGFDRVFLGVVLHDNGDGTLDIAFYKNGEPDGTGTIDERVISSDQLNISYFAQSMEGMIDELRLYSTELTESEMKALFLYPSGNQYTSVSGTQIITEDLSVISANIGTITAGTLSSSDWAAALGIRLDLANRWLKMGGADVNAAGAAAGIFLGLDSSYKFYVGDGANQYFKFDGADLSWKGTNAELTTGGQLSVSNILATGGIIGGWTVTNEVLYNLGLGTPGVDPGDGIILDAASRAIYIYEDFAKRIQIGLLSSGIYGLRGYDTEGSTVLFELSDTQTMIAGWNFTNEALYNLGSGTPDSNPAYGIVIDGPHQYIRIYEATEIRVQLGFLQSNVYGLRGFASNGTDVIFELSDNKQQIGDWKFDDKHLYSLVSGTPESFPSDGIVLDGAKKDISIYENTELRLLLGRVSGGIYGIKGFADDGTTPIFEISDTRIMLAGWNFTATTLTSANITIDSGNDRIVVDGITIDGANNRIRSSNYDPGVLGTGFTLEPDLLEVGNIRARGMIRTAVFQKDVVSIIGGNLMVLPGDVLNVDMTALDSSTLEIEGNETFAVNDILWIKDDTNEEWLQVTNIGSAPIYTVTRDKGSDYGVDANPVWKKGASVSHYGNTTSGGTVYMTASEANAPYIQVNTHDGDPWTTQTTRLRIGNLNGYLGYDSDIFGIGIGDTTNFLKFDPTDGIQIQVSAANGLTMLAGSDIKLVAHASNPGKLNFEGTSYSATLGPNANADGSQIQLLPAVTETVSLYLGSVTKKLLGLEVHANGVSLTARYLLTAKTASVLQNTGNTLQSIWTEAYHDATHKARIGIVSTSTDELIYTRGNFRPSVIDTYTIGQSNAAYLAGYFNGLIISDNGYIGIGSALERIEFYTAGYVSVMGANFGIGTATPTQLLDVGEKAAITVIGGIAIKLTNKTGSNSIEGEIVEADTVVENAVVLIAANGDHAIGFFYESGIVDGAEAWIVVSGIAEVKADAGGFSKGDRLITSATAGRADVDNAPAVAVHFQEIGHAIEDAAANSVGKCVLHFN